MQNSEQEITSPASKLTTEELKQELKNRGYQTDNLWQIDDVNQKLDEYNKDLDEPVVLTEEQKMGVLVQALHNDYAMEAIWGCIEYQVQEEISQMEQ